jgi:hypothetical protein
MRMKVRLRADECPAEGITKVTWEARAKYVRRELSAAYKVIS